MDDDRGDERVPDQGGVFGNLPGSRLGSRSPRRRSGDTAKPKPRRAATRKPPPPAPAALKGGPAERTPLAEPAAERAAEPPKSGPGGIEEIAWAGVAVAAEAATIGVRLASRAIEALRGSTEREDR